jgi:hypothetical protein
VVQLGEWAVWAGGVGFGEEEAVDPEGEFPVEVFYVYAKKVILRLPC